ncbi:histidine phosphatase family protein [uncultured Parabacteroides sp.]|uniref:histidine phosphatase family protein n=1 Tax=uncultured Parabacteroides sp. TaxID=512312 RepID=UPI002617DEAE|nr:histidine phosphatase family protein [uncultured Parabacteroides sp.]
MITLYLTRHGQTEQNLAHIFQGQMQGTLTEEGKRQAAELGEQLAGVHFDTLISSDLDRARKTVEIGFGNRNIPHITTPLLREIDWGSWTGQPIPATRLHPPLDAETDEMLYMRTGKFLDYLKANFDGQTVLAVGHGMINRRIVACLENLDKDQVKKVPVFSNCEYRIFRI